METKIANTIADIALQAIKDALKNHALFKNISVFDSGGSVGQNNCTLKFSFIEQNTNSPFAMPNTELTDELVGMGMALPGMKISFRGVEYAVIKANQKFYRASDVNGKVWKVPFVGSKAVK